MELNSTQCDACTRVESGTPWSERLSDLGWMHVTYGGREYDLCPRCAEKALRAADMGSVVVKHDERS